MSPAIMVILLMLPELVQTPRRLDESARIGPLPDWLTQRSHSVRVAASQEAKCLIALCAALWM